MQTREYLCFECGHRWTDISEYPVLECPECQAEEFKVIWQANAYD